MFDDIEQKLNSNLMAKRYDRVCELLCNKDVADSAISNQKIFRMIQLMNIYVEESSKGVARTVFDDRSLSDLMRLYSKVSFCLRRIEFCLEEDLLIDAIDYLVKEQISLICALGVVCSNNYFYNKEYLIGKVINIYKIINGD